MPEADPIQFGPYHLLEKIATGGMAEVWRARLEGLAGFEKTLVIKKILPNLSKDKEFTDLFEDEARIAVQLQHVNIVQVFDLGKVGETYYMAMEFVHGLDLARLSTKAKTGGPFPVALALFVFSEVMKALAFAHLRTDDDGVPLRIVHCDISPQNILVSYAGEVKITDFGISRAAFQSSGVHEVIRGKYAYMSPEQVDGKPLDGRSDIFSMGIVLYELLTGKRLFKGKTREETLGRVRRAEVPSPRAYRPEISEDLEGLILRCLEARPEDRFPDGATVVEEVGRLMVREGHRATNNDLAAFIRQVIEAAPSSSATKKPSGEAEPTNVVVLAIEAGPPPRSLATPRTPLANLTQEWAGLIVESDGEIWERSEGSLLVCWTGKDGIQTALKKAVATSQQLRKATQKAGHRLSAGVAPGVVRISPDTHRPPDGWELSGPFYLARWMMNLSAHRGRVLLTEVGAREAGSQKTTLIGRIGIKGNRYIHLYEVG